MNYTPESIEEEKARLLNLVTDAPQRAQDGLNLLMPYIKSLDEINRLSDLSGELYLLAIMHDIEKANQIVAKFARNS